VIRPPSDLTYSCTVSRGKSSMIPVNTNVWELRHMGDASSSERWDRYCDLVGAITVGVGVGTGVDDGVGDSILTLVFLFLDGDFNGVVLFVVVVDVDDDVDVVFDVV